MARPCVPTYDHVNVGELPACAEAPYQEDFTGAVEIMLSNLTVTVR